MLKYFTQSVKLYVTENILTYINKIASPSGINAFFIYLTYIGDIIIMNVVLKTTLNGVKKYDI